MSWLQTQSEFVVAESGALWRLLGMVMKLCAICGVMICWLVLSFGVEGIREIADGAGLFQQYCSTCEEVVKTRSVGKSKECVNCGDSARSKFAIVVLLVGATGYTFLMIVMFLSRFRWSNLELSQPSCIQDQCICRGV